MMTEEKEAALFNQCADLEKVVEADENHFAADTKYGNKDSDVIEPKNNFSAKQIDLNDVKNAQIKTHPDPHFVKDEDLSLGKQENTTTSTDLSTDATKVSQTQLVSSEVLVSVTKTLHYLAAPPPPLPPRPPSSEIVVSLSKKFDDAREVDTNHCGDDDKSKNKESDATASPKNDFTAKENDKNYNEGQSFQSEIRPNSEIVKNVGKNISIGKQEKAISLTDLSKGASETAPTQQVASEARVSGSSTSNRPAPPLPPRPSDDKSANIDSHAITQNDVLAKQIDENYNDVKISQSDNHSDSEMNNVDNLLSKKQEKSNSSIDLSKNADETLPTQHLASEASVSGSGTSNRPAPPLPPRPSQTSLNDNIACKEIDNAIEDDENRFITGDKLANDEAATPPKNDCLANQMDSNCNDVKPAQIEACNDSEIVKDFSLKKLKNTIPSIDLSKAASETVVSVSKTSHRPAPPPPLPPLNDTIVSFCKKFEEAIKTAQTEGPLIVWPPPNIDQFMLPGSKDLANALFKYAVPAKLDFELFQGMLDRFSDASGDDLFKCEIFAIGFIWRSLLAAMFLADGSFGTSMLQAAYLRYAIPSLSRFEVSVLKNFLETSVELNAILPLQLEAVTVIREIYQPSK